MTTGSSTVRSPAEAAQLRLLQNLADDAVVPHLSAAVAALKHKDPYVALASLPITKYDAYKEDAEASYRAATAGDAAAAAAAAERVCGSQAHHMLHWTKTSGTTGASKLIPFTMAHVQLVGPFHDLILNGIIRKVAPCISTKRAVHAAAGSAAAGPADAAAVDISPSNPLVQLNMVVPGKAEKLPTGQLVGAATTVMAAIQLNKGRMPFAIDPRMAFPFPFEILTAASLSASHKYYLIWLCSVAFGAGRIHLLTDAFGGNLLSAACVLRTHAARIARDLRAGRLSSAFPEELDFSNDDGTAEGPAGQEGQAHGQLPVAVRDAVERFIRGPQPEAAAALEAAVAAAAAQGGEGLLEEVLPCLVGISCIVTGSMSKYIPALKRLAPNTPLITPAYAGSEGRYGINEQLLQPGPWATPPGGDAQQRFVLVPNGDCFFEFLPLGDDGAEGEGQGEGGPDAADEGDGTALARRLLTIGVVEAGREYELVLTTCCGFARYRIGDIIRVEGRFTPQGPTHQDLAGAPIVSFVRRAGMALNLVAEKFEEETLLRVILDTQQQLAQAAAAGSKHPFPGAADICAREDVGGNGDGKHYVFYIELQQHEGAQQGAAVLSEVGNVMGASEVVGSIPSSEAVSSWAACLNRTLEEASFLYSGYVSSGQVHPPVLKVVRQGSFAALKAEAVSRGTSPSQYKLQLVVAPGGWQAQLLESHVVVQGRASR